MAAPTTTTTKTSTTSTTSTIGTTTSYEDAAKKDPQAWSLVWDDQIKDKKTWIDNVKTGTPVYYSFDTKDSQAEYAQKGYLKPMTDDQKANVKLALQKLSNATGVTFVEQSGIKGGLVFAQADLADAPDDKASTLGEHQEASITVKDSTGATKTVNQNTIMLNYHVTENSNLKPGTAGFETLLHELGHAAGLDDTEGDSSQNLANKYPDLDDGKYTIMSYEGEVTNQDYTALDKRALAILYPTDQRKKTATSTGLTSSDAISPQDEYTYVGAQSLTANGSVTAEDEYEYITEDNGGSTTGGGSNIGSSGNGGGSSGGSGGSGGGSEDHEDDSGSTVVAVEEGPVESKLRLYGTADQSDLLRPRTDAPGSGLTSAFGSTAFADNSLFKLGGVLAQG